MLKKEFKIIVSSMLRTQKKKINKIRKTMQEQNEKFNKR